MKLELLFCLYISARSSSFHILHFISPRGSSLRIDMKLLFDWALHRNLVTRQLHWWFFCNLSSRSPRSIGCSLGISMNQAWWFSWGCRRSLSSFSCTLLQYHYSHPHRLQSKTTQSIYTLDLRPRWAPYRGGGTPPHICSGRLGTDTLPNTRKSHHRACVHRAGRCKIGCADPTDTE